MAHFNPPEPLVEYALGGVAKRNQCCYLSELQGLVLTAHQRKVPLFISYYVYTNGIRDHLKLNKTVRGYRGPVGIRELVLDIDRGGDSAELVHRRFKAFLERLSNETRITEEFTQPWFSGTGFHLSMQNIFNFQEHSDLPRLVKDTLVHLFPEADAIYDRTRLIRVGNTINEKSNLYKIPLTHEEVFSLSHEEIASLARSPRMDFAFNELLSEPIMASEQRKLLPVDEVKEYRAPEIVTEYVSCTQKMYEAGPPPPEGGRHDMILRIASSRRKGGAPFQATYEDLKSWCPSYSPQEVERLVRAVYSTPLTYTCKDTLMQKFCDPKCVYFKHKNFGDEAVSAAEMEKSFIQYVKTDMSAQSFSLSEVFPGIKQEFRFVPGELVVVIGDTKVGKTALVQNIVTRLARMKTLYISLEVHQNLIFRRFVQIQHGMTRTAVEDHYRNGGPSLTGNLRHIEVITTPKTMGEFYVSARSINPQIIVIDTTDGIKTKYRNDPIAASNYIALELRDFATQTQTIVIAIHHISKGSVTDVLTGKRKPLTVHSGKYSSTLEQKADKVLGIEPKMDKHVVVRCLAARDEGEFRTDMKFNTDTFQFKEVS